MKLLDAISYNGGRGPADGNNYWRRFTAAHYAYVSALLAVFGLWAGTLALMLAGNATAEAVIRAIPARPGSLLIWLFALSAVFCLWFATGRAWIAALTGGLAAVAETLIPASDLTSAQAFFAGLWRVCAGDRQNACLLAGTLVLCPALLALIARGRIHSKKARLVGAPVCAVLAAAALAAALRG